MKLCVTAFVGEVPGVSLMHRIVFIYKYNSTRLVSRNCMRVVNWYHTGYCDKYICYFQWQNDPVAMHRSTVCFLLPLHVSTTCIPNLDTALEHPNTPEGEWSVSHSWSHSAIIQSADV